MKSKDSLMPGEELKDQMPLVSVVIPTYDRVDLLIRAINSVQHQSVRNIEIIVVQNGYQERAKEKVLGLQKHDERIRYLYQTKPCAVEARNRGILNTRAPYVAFLDDDDEWHPNKLEIQIAELKGHENRNVGLVAARGEQVNAHGQFIKIMPDYFSGTPTRHALVTQGSIFYTLSAVLIRRECFSKVGLFDPQYLIANDYEFYLRLSLHYEMKMLEEPLFRYYLHPNNLSKNKQAKYAETLQILESVKNNMAPSLEKKYLRKAIKNHGINFYTISVDLIQQAKYKSAYDMLTKALRCDPLVGSKVSWYRFSNPAFRFFRPYWWLAYSFLRATTRR